MRKAPFVILLLLSFFAVSFANDGAFYVSGNTLIPLQETKVALRKEVLKFYIHDFGWMRVDVDFTFYNPGPAKKLSPRPLMEMSRRKSRVTRR